MLKSSNGTALIVEDEPAIATICARILNDTGWDVKTIQNGEDAKDWMESNDPGLILLDLTVPKMNGIELFIWMKQEKNELTSKVIFMTGKALEGETQQFLHRVNRPFILKPFRPQEMTAIIKKETGFTDITINNEMV